MKSNFEKIYNEERKKRHKRRVKLMLMRVSLLAMLLVVSTYAWFTSQKDITLSNIRGTVEVVENMEISLDAKTWYQKIDLSNAVDTFNNAQESRDEALNELGAGIKSTALPILPEQLFPVSGVGEIGQKILPLYTGEVTSASLSGITACEEEKTIDYVDKVVDNGYIAFDMYIKNTSRDDEADVLQLNVNSSAQVLTETIRKQITDVTGNKVDRIYNGNEASGLQNTIRVALAKYDGEVSSTSTQVEILNSTKDANVVDLAIWEPNAYDHVESIVSNNNKLINGTNANKIEFTSYHPFEALETYAISEDAVGETIENVYNIASTGLGAQKTFKTDNLKNGGDEIESFRIYAPNSKPINIQNISEENFEISPNTVTRYRVYVWLEGQDVDCINIASLGGGIELDLGLTKDDETGDVLVNIDDRISYSTTDITADPVTATITLEKEIASLPDGWEYVDATKVAIQKEYDDNIIEQVEVTDEDGDKSKLEVTIGNIETNLVQSITGKESSVYGEYTNYPVDIDGDSTDNDWQIFYSDGTNVFLKADNAALNSCMNTAELASIGIIKSTNISYGPWAIYWENPTSLSYTISNTNKYMISKADEFTQTNANYQATGSLLDTTVWTNMFGNNQFAESAIGGPTIEMFVASWNAKGYTELKTENNSTGYFIGKAGYDLEEIADQMDYTKGGYMIMPSDIARERKDPMYFIPSHDINGTLDWGYYIASPGAIGENNLGCAVSGGFLAMGIEYTDDCTSVCPIVCLKPEVKATRNDAVWNLSM